MSEVVVRYVVTNTWWCGLDVYLWKPHHMDALAVNLFDQGPHFEGCPEDAAYEGVKGDTGAQWCQTCGRWRLVPYGKEVHSARIESRERTQKDRSHARAPRTRV